MLRGLAVALVALVLPLEASANSLERRESLAARQDEAVRHPSAAMPGMGHNGTAVAKGQLGTAHPASVVDIGALTVDSDFTVVMREDVPEDMRWAALRRLWVLMQLPASCHELCAEPEPAAYDKISRGPGERR